MVYAVFSDVHSNLEAFSAVIDFFSRSRIDQYLFVGDIVGYGADPGPCIDLLRKLNPVCVAGNHDWAVAGLLATDYFNDAAAEAVRWTQERLSPAEKLFLAHLKPVHEAGEFCLVHGTLVIPEEFDYMLGVEQARPTFAVLERKFCFVGHTHLPGAFISDGKRISEKKAVSLSIQDTSRAIVNCGSVGQPRDGDPRACCCIFDSDESLVTWHRIAYDLRPPARKIREAGLPASLADRLALGR